MKLRVGIPGGIRLLLAKARALNAPILVSANSLWRDNKKKFSGWKCYTGFDVALDSGGFVAMKRYGRYRWSVSQYVALAKTMQPAWWAQMDFCCEPEIASDRTTVSRRISMTAQHLQECQRVADGEGVCRPLPVLQGWCPEDYCRGPIYESDYHWPDMVGIGSVCRRQVNGKDGVMAVVEALDRVVPPHVRFHLFGVKGTAVAKLVEHFPNRIGSTDSMAWDLQARWLAYNAKASCSSAHRASVMEHWYTRHTAIIDDVTRQPTLWNHKNPA